ncbi:MAG: hypothetical protein HY245_01710 [Rhizobiales bacterium]|nr:hypothetical protein [Hyphomicrobiales bacterium]MBI3672144.1 hypothetical protein [Hyphomicrobiales bacterium]
MKSPVLMDILHLAENWPVEDQEELVRAALCIEQRRSGDFTLTSDDWKIIDARLEAARLGQIATDEEVAATFVSLKDIHKESTLGGLSWRDLRDTGRK